MQTIHRKVALAIFAVSIHFSQVATAQSNLDIQTVQRLRSESVEDVKAAIEAIAHVEPRLSLPILGAFSEGELGFDEQSTAWLLRGTSLIRVADGTKGVPSGRLQKTVANNQTRRYLDEVLSRLRLKSTDTVIRRAAAAEIAHHPDLQSVEALRELVAQEPDRQIRADMRIAMAKVDIQSKNRAVRLSAARALGEASDISMREPLTGLLGAGPASERDPEVRKAISSAVAAIEWQELKIRTLANLLYGLSLGSVLLLAALGLAITFGLMKVINMAHGEMLMLGAYATYLSQVAFLKYAPHWLGYYLAAAVPLAFILTAAIGLLLERLVVRRLYGRPLETLLATWGLSLILIQATRTLFGAQNVAVASPEWLAGGWELMPTVVVPYSRVLVLVFTLVVVSFVWYILQRTSLGLKLRAVTQNREMASSLGIHTQRIDAWTFALGSGVAGLGGVALSQLGNVGPELGQQHIIDSFMVVVLGGVGNVVGSIVGAFGLGVISKFIEPAAGAVLGKIAILVAIILFIQWRPQGLFALKGRAQES